ncbi:MAG: hypothetical protein RSC00_01200 [Ruthenibacterium sp.]
MRFLGLFWHLAGMKLFRPALKGQGLKQKAALFAKEKTARYNHAITKKGIELLQVIRDIHKALPVVRYFILSVTEWKG